MEVNQTKIDGKYYYKIIFDDGEKVELNRWEIEKLRGLLNECLDSKYYDKHQMHYPDYHKNKLMLTPSTDNLSIKFTYNDHSCEMPVKIAKKYYEVWKRQEISFDKPIVIHFPNFAAPLGTMEYYDFINYLKIFLNDTSITICGVEVNLDKQINRHRIY